MVLASSDIIAVLLPPPRESEERVGEEEEAGLASKAPPPSSGVDGKGKAMAIPSNKFKRGNSLKFRGTWYVSLISLCPPLQNKPRGPILADWP